MIDNAEDTIAYLQALPQYQNSSEKEQETSERLFSLKGVSVCIEHHSTADGDTYFIAVDDGGVTVRLLPFVSITKAIAACEGMSLRILRIDAPESVRKETPARPTFKQAMHKKMSEKYGEGYAGLGVVDFSSDSDKNGSINDSSGSSGIRVGMSVTHAPESE